MPLRRRRPFLMAEQFARSFRQVRVRVLSASAEFLFQVLLLGLLGVAMARLNWPRVPFLLGFVIGPILEGALTRTILTVGTGAFHRPLVLLILAIATGFILTVILRRRGRSRVLLADSPADENPAKNIPFMLGLMSCITTVLCVNSP